MYKVSVIVPVYNCERYIERCIKSLLGQTLEDIEVILVDDGSSDNSLDICRKYEEKYPNVIVIHQENSGAAQARIRGIERASGEYIGFIDSDDWADPNMYKILYQESQKLDADIIQCGYQKVNEYQENTSGATEIGNVRVYSSENALYQLYGVDSKAEFNFLLWNKIYKANILKEIKLPTYIKTINDVPVIPRAFYNAKKIAVLDNQFIYYFMRNDNSNKSIMDELKASKEKMVWSHLQAFNDVSLYFKGENKNLYLLSLRYTIAWALTAVKDRSISKECKRYAVNEIIKSSKIVGNPYIPRKKKIIASFLQLIPII